MAGATPRKLRSHTVPLANVPKKVAEVKRKKTRAKTQRGQAEPQKPPWVGEPEPGTVHGAAVLRYKGFKLDGEEYRVGEWCVCVFTLRSW